MLADTVRVPGTPGTAMSERLTTQVTVARTLAGVPTGAPKPLVSTLMVIHRQLTFWLLRAWVAAALAVSAAWAWVREIEADRAASVAAEPTAWLARATRPANTMSPTKSMKAGTPMAASMTADPRSRPANRWCHRSFGRLIG